MRDEFPLRQIIMTSRDYFELFEAIDAVQMGRDEDCESALLDVLRNGRQGLSEDPEEDYDENQEIRAAAARSLGTLVSERAVPEMLRILNGKGQSSDLRSEAALQLGIIGDSRAKMPLALTLRDDEDEEVRRYAVEGIRCVMDQEIVPYLIAALDDTYYEVRATAAENLGILGDRHALIPLMRLKDDPSDEVRYCVDAALKRLARLSEDLLAATG